MVLVEPSPSEVSVYDTRVRFQGYDTNIYLNVKSAVADGRRNKDDISKADGLFQFFSIDPDRQLFICTFVIRFGGDMNIEFADCHVMPIMWLPDIYVNPSNNGNLQSSKYKDLSAATRRTNSEFLIALGKEMEIARQKRAAKR